ncbi:hypothetical protein J3R30DRAFT_3400258 [Lentinula aciculospora]|uniref:Uncharacterized protein n=1 Tax=Lentinula aciculospora TaxID=153920 RepID=A0A9W9APF1_9AGAR|nr:hypothetical protein J3R30DRAFT_3400258 [Lentinula aciculospora]
MAEAKLRVLGSEYNVKPTSADSDIPRRRISHRHSQSTPTIPALSFSSTSSRTSTAESLLTTPVNSVFNECIPQIHMPDITDNSDDEDNLDTPTPTPSPKAKARTPSRIRSAATVLSGKSPSILRNLSLSRSESFSRSLTPPPRAKPSLAMSPEIHPRVDRVSGESVTAPKPRRASQLTSPMSLTSFSLPASPLHQTTVLPSSQQQRPLTRSEHLLRSALLKDEFAQGSATPSSNAMFNRHSKTHRRRHSHATVSADSLIHNNIYIYPLPAAVEAPSSSPVGRNTPTPRPRPVSPVHTKSSPVTRTMYPRPNPRSQSYSHALNEASSSARLPLTPHEQVLRARLEKVLSTGSVALPSSYQYGSAIRSNGPTSSADDDSLSYASYHDLSGEEYGYSADLRQLRLKKAERNKHRASAPANGSGFLGWLWKSNESDEEEFPSPIPAPLTSNRRQAQSQDDDERMAPNSPRTPRTNALPHVNALSASPSLSPYRISSPHRTASPQLSPSPSRLRAHTQPLPSSPNRSPYGQGYAYSPKPKHAYSLGIVPSVGQDILTSAVAGGSGGETRVNDKDRMLTPPPTPPRGESVLLGEGFGQVDSPLTSTRETELGSHEEVANLEMSLMKRRESSAAKSRRGQRSLGLGRPGAKSSEDSVSSTSSSLVEAVPSITVGVEADREPTSHATTSPALSPLLSPASALSTTSSFNARTASLQCQQIDGYISFASIEGLGEPPVSAPPTENGDAGSMNSDDRDGQKKGLFGRLFGR